MASSSDKGGKYIKARDRKNTKPILYALPHPRTTEGETPTATLDPGIHNAAPTHTAIRSGMHGSGRGCKEVRHSYGTPADPDGPSR
jgi:hypothetical protein